MSKELEVAIEAAKEAGKILKRGWEHELEILSKADDSLVTQIDHESEEKIISIIKAEFPNHQILAEESGGQGSSDYCWYIDPIDGTTNYSRRIPICAISIALANQGEVITGVIFNPFTNELYSAQKDNGCHLNGKKVTTSAVEKLEEAVIAVSYSHDAEIRKKVAQAHNLTINNRTKREYGSVAYEMALLANGRLDAYFFAGHNAWDYAAGMLMAREAGGIVTNAAGNDLNLEDKYVVAAANKTLHSQLLNIVK